MRVLVGLSGGVDSSAVVAHLVEQGDTVIAATLVMQHDPIAVPGPEALERARQTCESLGVPLIEYDASEAFRKYVSGPFCAEYLKGLTPSPCIGCNEHVKFATLVRLSDELSCDAVATGHYVGRTEGADGMWRLVRGRDTLRDQSYFMCRLGPDVVSRCLFPLCDATKAQTRHYAAEEELPASDAHDSQGLCFAPGGDYRTLLPTEDPMAFAPGDIVDEQGSVLGHHEGTPGYTIGQRKGLGLAGGPWYVQRIDVDGHRVVVSRLHHPTEPTMTVRDLVYHPDASRPEDELVVQTRFHGPIRHARVRSLGTHGEARIEMLDGEELVVPGQTAALYQGDVVVGGGIITS
ncbi:MAG: tRNA 2-thiouridine(34) synthase MnmA [Atopobiaceae bacterium]|nr:tRNA 2-thiouridine(34) synthase MnmA [Atopobiaceae bacterium]MCH4180008.1 tRNA 2-thiouridine(34) synthase MnmA [Atopobiaceae bacterium]MCH4213940.1 tRNA 2-thiouridine(34) synthase MnmA [Atopobiaceae bacterium]MCH4275597.1 tRNA 2-thiouridine(34) synthase MnmA [Atopobiaceae bacterium]MCI1227097.1 tRNA 2-thiouridine(34) synthase MnmA [Atopobiaceae bacterium]